MKSLPNRNIIIVLAILNIVGIIGFLTSMKGLFIDLTPIFLFINFVVLIDSQKITNFQTLYLFIIYAFCFLYEVIGVHTGYPFGQYQYLEGLGYKVFEVPLLIGINWLILLLSTYTIAKAFENVILRVLVAATLMTALDVLIEQLAPSMQYWVFEDGYAPIQNYGGWFIGALALHIVMVKVELPVRRDVGWFIYVSQIVFFGTILLLQ